MNEIIFREKMFPTRQEQAYQRYVESAEKYTTPLSFEAWLKEIKNMKSGC